MDRKCEVSLCVGGVEVSSIEGTEFDYGDDGLHCKSISPYREFTGDIEKGDVITFDSGARFIVTESADSNCDMVNFSVARIVDS